MALTFHLVESEEDLQRTARVAHDIWFEYWPALIGQAQTEYMVKNMQSYAAIVNDIRNIFPRFRFLFLFVVIIDIVFIQDFALDSVHF